MIEAEDLDDYKNIDELGDINNNRVKMSHQQLDQILEESFYSYSEENQDMLTDQIDKMLKCIDVNAALVFE